jgi:hypothetical protein
VIDGGVMRRGSRRTRTCRTAGLFPDCRRDYPLERAATNFFPTAPAAMPPTSRSRKCAATARVAGPGVPVSEGEKQSTGREGIPATWGFVAGDRVVGLHGPVVLCDRQAAGCSQTLLAASSAAARPRLPAPRRTGWTTNRHGFCILGRNQPAWAAMHAEAHSCCSTTTARGPPFDARPPTSPRAGSPGRGSRRGLGICRRSTALFGRLRRWQPRGRGAADRMARCKRRREARRQAAL